ncbi:MAG: imidazole glycerol phosphate synthase subunit HisH [Chloroflexota bacterium]|nr:imidazole glycerol phosphate synthase subunit HisH [Chloroflexota bacterium]
MKRVAVLDYGAGNVYSVCRALEKAGASVVLTGDAEVLRAADGIVFPGQGSAASAMEGLNASGLSDVLREHVRADRPLLGVCLGMQIFFGANEEGPSRGLELLPGEVVLMRGERRVPHMGWNNLRVCNGSQLLRGIPDGSYAYWAHSYQVVPSEQSDIIATSDYEGEVVAIVGRGNLVGTQFHPEKSGEVGLRMYENFVEMLGR